MVKTRNNLRHSDQLQDEKGAVIRIHINDEVIRTMLTEVMQKEPSCTTTHSKATSTKDFSLAPLFYYPSKCPTSDTILFYHCCTWKGLRSYNVTHDGKSSAAFCKGLNFSHSLCNHCRSNTVKQLEIYLENWFSSAFSWFVGFFVCLFLNL